MLRRCAFLGVVGAALFAWTVPAFAHVSVSPDEAPAGGFTTLTFQVPNEEDDATTTKVEVTFPADNPIADASVQPVPGWTIDVAKAKLETPVTTDEGDSLDERVDSVTWTAADGEGIGAGEFQQFLVSVGLPDEAGALAFPALQTYSNGDVVRWVDPVTEGGPEAEHPEPVVTLTEGGEDPHGSTPITIASPDGTANGPVATAQDDADTAKTIGIVAIIFAVIALAGVAFSLARKSPSSS